MQNSLPSIFNDVLGPVMRGPSSSHVAAAARIGLLIRSAFLSRLDKIIVEFSTGGSLAESYHGHGSDLGFACGILGMELTDPNVSQALNIIKNGHVSVEYKITDEHVNHPNNYKIHIICNDSDKYCLQAISTGGGMIELWQIDGLPVSIHGDFYELVLLFQNGDFSPLILSGLSKLCPDNEYILNYKTPDQTVVEVKSRAPYSPSVLSEIKQAYNPLLILTFDPVIPVLSSKEYSLPFSNFEEFWSILQESNTPVWRLAAAYESARGRISEQEVFKKAGEIYDWMHSSIVNGLSPQEYSDRILGPQAYKMKQAMDEGRLAPIPLLNHVISSITAVMETKSSMGVIVAAPTAGSCGCLAGTVLGIAEFLEIGREKVIQALLSAGLIGVFFSQIATFAAEVGGCQVECGAASGMAACAVAQMFGGTAKQCISAASMALQNVTGLACDPVANRVEVPCLGKNIMAGTNAISSANMALAGYDSVIPLDETISAILEIGKILPPQLRCTLGGLGCTKTSRELQKRLNNI